MLLSKTSEISTKTFLAAAYVWASVFVDGTRLVSLDANMKQKLNLVFSGTAVKSRNFAKESSAETGLAIQDLTGEYFWFDLFKLVRRSQMLCVVYGEFASSAQNNISSGSFICHRPKISLIRHRLINWMITVH